MDRKTEMTAEEKQLLFKDICARLPYGLKCRQHKLDSQICTMYPEYLKNIEDVEKYEPYLHSMSSMTEDEKEQFEELTYSDYEDFETTTGRRMILATDSDTGYGSEYFSENISEVLDWLNKHHFDYRGLIEKGLALEAPKNMYNNKK